MPRFLPPSLIFVGLLVLPLASACGSEDGGGDVGGSGGGGRGSIKIGVPAPLSGDSASAGQDIVAAARVAADEINNAGGVGGRKIQIVAADDGCNARQGAQAARSLIAQGVVAVAGGYCSSAAVPAVPIFGRRNVPFVIDAATNPVLTDDGGGKVFRTCGRDDRQGLFSAKFMTGHLKAGRIAVLHDNTTYAKGLAEAVTASVKQLGGAEVVYDDALQPGRSDYKPVLTKVASAKPDVLYFTGYSAEAGVLMKQRKRLGLRFALMGGDATTDTTALKAAGPAANGYIATTAPLPRDLPAASGFTANYKARTGVPPGPFSVYEYDAVKVLAKAIGDAGSTEGADIIEALHAVTNHPGVTGPLTFDEKGDRAGLLYITVSVRNGAFAGFKRLSAVDGQWADVVSG